MTGPPWPTEDILDTCRLFLRVHQNNVRKGLGPNIFVEHEGGMSTDWAKYSSAAEARARAKNPTVNGVITLHVADVRKATLQAEHKPLDTNRAHTDVTGIGDGGPATNAKRHLLWTTCRTKEWTIAPDAP